jgi:hypothetical protein
MAKGKIFMCWLALISCSLQAQVYNYEILSQSNIETNPSYLASGRFSFCSAAVHQGSPVSQNKLYYDNVRLGIYSKPFFSGAGISLNRTALNDSNYYMSAGIGAAYRIVMFNKMFTRIGVMYKFMHSVSEKGSFDNYRFISDSAGGIKRNNFSNLNLSISFSSASSRFYLVLGLLNYSPSRVDNYRNFPAYYYAMIGDLGRMLGSRRWNIFFSTLIKQSPQSNNYLQSWYLNLQNQSMLLTRRSTIVLGGRAGWADQAFIHASPFISYHYKYKKTFTCQLMGDFGWDPQKASMPFKPGTQITFIYEY